MDSKVIPIYTLRNSVFFRIKKYLLGLITLFLVLISSNLNSNANAADFAEISGTVKNFEGVPQQVQVRLATSWMQQTNYISNSDASGKFRMLVPTGMQTLRISHGVLDTKDQKVTNGIAEVENWTLVSGAIEIKDGMDFQITLPQKVRLNLTLVDAQNNLLPNTYVFDMGTMDGKSSTLVSITDNYRINWQGRQSIGLVRSSTGNYQITMYPSSSSNFRYVLLPDPRLFEDVANVRVYSEKSLKLCFPVNFGASKSTPSDCYDLSNPNPNDVGQSTPMTNADKTKQTSLLKQALQDIGTRITIILDAKQSQSTDLSFQSRLKDIRANLDSILNQISARDSLAPGTILESYQQKLNDLLDAANEVVPPAKRVKSTITCTKGKISKKVTDFNPKCPTGFKKK